MRLSANGASATRVPLSSSRTVAHPRANSRTCIGAPSNPGHVHDGSSEAGGTVEGQGKGAAAVGGRAGLHNCVARAIAVLTVKVGLQLVRQSVRITTRSAPQPSPQSPPWTARSPTAPTAMRC